MNCKATKLSKLSILNQIKDLTKTRAVSRADWYHKALGANVRAAERLTRQEPQRAEREIFQV